MGEAVLLGVDRMHMITQMLPGVVIRVRPCLLWLLERARLVGDEAESYITFELDSVGRPACTQVIQWQRDDWVIHEVGGRPHRLYAIWTGPEGSWATWVRSAPGCRFGKAYDDHTTC